MSSQDLSPAERELAVVDAAIVLHERAARRLEEMKRRRSFEEKHLAATAARAAQAASRTEAIGIYLEAKRKADEESRRYQRLQGRMDPFRIDPGDVLAYQRVAWRLREDVLPAAAPAQTDRFGHEGRLRVPRARGAGRPAVRVARRGGDSGDSDSDSPGPPLARARAPPRRARPCHGRRGHMPVRAARLPERRA